MNARLLSDKMAHGEPITILNFALDKIIKIDSMLPRVCSVIDHR